MKITKSTRNTVQVPKMNVEVSCMDVFTTSMPVTQMNVQEILEMDRIVIQCIQEEAAARQHAQEEEIARRRAPGEAVRIAQEAQERRRAENPVEYARLFNDSVDAETEWHAAMLAAEAAGGDDAYANYLVVTTNSAYMAAECARINF